ncbi:MAG: hypothetical protein LBP33_10710 [Candidatus Adiutrix sp.]|nr:hypothetical protein [Candidatus Adiutrix sp.]
MQKTEKRAAGLFSPCSLVLGSILFLSLGSAGPALAGSDIDVLPAEPPLKVAAADTGADRDRSGPDAAVRSGERHRQGEGRPEGLKRGDRKGEGRPEGMKHGDRKGEGRPEGDRDGERQDKDK